MKEPIDIKKITDIPEIENYLEYLFQLKIYERGDKTIIYECHLNNLHRIEIDMISDESLIEGELELVQILTHYEIAYFHWILFDDLDNKIQDYQYRPLVDDSQKNFQ
jgi:hypothetical protein